MDEFGLPEKHGISLILLCFFNLGCKELLSLFLLDFVNFSEGSATEFLLDYEATLKDLLSI